MRNNYSQKALLLFFFGCGGSLLAAAQEKQAAAQAGDGGNAVIWGLCLLLVFAVTGLFYLLGRMNLLNEGEKQSFSLKSWWSALDAKLFTKAIPIEKEADHLLDHDYDGIQELDNSLPPWWKYGFYLSVVFSIVYFLRYHVWKTGPDPEQEYNTEMAIATKQMEEYRKKAGDMVDEKTVTMADATGIAEGQKIFTTTCFACHGAKGEGGVGPNLTDNYWLHGGTINDVFKTIKYGVPDKGMQAWEKTYSPSQIKDLASYIKSLAGTNPPNAKAPQGEPMEEKNTNQQPAAKDSVAAVAKR